MSGFNYSKWDNIECSDSEEEVDSNSPQVTRLDSSSTVTFGGDSDGITVSPSPSSTTPTPNLPPRTRSPLTPPPTKPFLPSTLNGSTIHYKWPSTTLTTPIHWSQTSTTLILNISIPPSVKSTHCTVVGKFLPYTSRHLAVGSPKSNLEVKIVVPETGEVMMLQHKLQHDVYLGDEDDPVGVEMITPDWELVGHGVCRYLKVELIKAQPMEGVKVWWTRVFEKGGCEWEVEDMDVEGFEGRESRGGGR